jgi:hypothetical protein
LIRILRKIQSALGRNGRLGQSLEPLMY